MTPRLALLKRGDANPAESGPTRSAQTRSADSWEHQTLGPIGRRRIGKTKRIFKCDILLKHP